MQKKKKKPKETTFVTDSSDRTHSAEATWNKSDGVAVAAYSGSVAEQEMRDDLKPFVYLE